MKAYCLKKAHENLPILTENLILPQVEQRVLTKGDVVTIDLGDHYVGYFSFVMDYVDFYIDAPIKLCVKFAESKDELEADFAAYKGKLCASWLQEEIVNLDATGEFRMPRRYAARYIRITVLQTPKKFTLSHFAFRAVTSADQSALQEKKIDDPLLAHIDSVATKTLKNCMQRVFEDGPKRDRRLWTGDFYLEALANSRTFANFALVRRCLYLFAASDKNAHGFFPGFVFENPVFASGIWFLEDYALLYAVTLCDYYEETKDEATFWELYPVAKSQIDAAIQTLDESGRITIPNGCDAFIDWCPGLHKRVSLHGVFLFALKTFSSLLVKLAHTDAAYYTAQYEAAKMAALALFYDKEKTMVVSEIDHGQYSVHATVWMILGGVLEGEAAKQALLAVLASKDSVKPFTPYMHHYVVAAFVSLSLWEEAFAYIKTVWGGMLLRGVDTFPEVYLPSEPGFSPYGDAMINSMCHAWSCTPSYFIRSYDT